MKELKPYQENAIDELYMYMNNMLHKTDRISKVIFKSPTGSGKTFSVTKLIEKLSKEMQDLDLCYLWITIGKGNLQKQSYYAVKKEVSEIIKCSLVEEEFFGSRKEIDENEIVFINWDKINNKSKQTGEWTNTIMKDKETENLPVILENTRNSGKQIVLIIDESHYGADSERSLEIIYDIIKPNLIFEMSATPVIQNYNVVVEVDPSDVVREGMIKNEVLINPELDIIYETNDEQNSEELILQAAYQKREELQKLYKKQGVDINPLVLIQIPNKDEGADKKRVVEKFLEEKGITYDNGQLYAWLDEEEKTHISYQERMDQILPFNSNIKFLIFKQAIDTGWDCPRTQILVKFRETQSITFEIQTLGRILRMPEGKHYDCDDLNKAYVYTNTQSIKVKQETYNPNIIKTLCSHRIEQYKATPLTSYYKKRGNQGDVTAEYYGFLEKELCQYFDIKMNLNINYKENFKKLTKKGILLEKNIEDSLIKDGTIPGEVIDRIKDEEIDKGATFGIKISENDLQYRFENIFRENLNGFPPVRSIPTMRQAMFYVLKKYLNINVARGGAIFIQNLIVNNQNIFSQILDRSIKEYKEIREEKLDTTNLEKINNNWEIEKCRYYNPNTFKQRKSEKSIYQPLYVETNMTDIEDEFIEYLDSKKDIIEWFWKNGSEHMEKNFGIKVSEKKTFQPDFIVKFKDGRIGIFDTKGGQYPEDDKQKSNALYMYINEEIKKGKKLIGGLIVLDKDKFRVYTEPEFVEFKKSPNKWEYLDNIMH